MPRTRRFLTDKTLIALDEYGAKYAADKRAWNEQHIAKRGEHVCTPDPADPWSTCDLIPNGEAS